MMGLSGIGRRSNSRYTPGVKNGKWQSVARPGAKQTKRMIYRGWEVEVINRRLGITIKQDTYSAVARCEHPPFQFFRGNLRSPQAALAVVQRFVDEWHEEHGELLSQDNVDQLRKQRMRRKLFKIRHQPPKRRR